MSDIFKFKGSKGLEKFRNIGFKFNKEDISQVKFVSPIEDSLKRLQEAEQKRMQLVNEVNRKKAEYDQEVLQTLKDIKHNTAGLSEVIPLLIRNVENQETIAELLKEAIDIAASQTKEEAVSKWRNVMDKANQLATDVETIQKIHGFANMIINLFQKLHG